MKTGIIETLCEEDMKESDGGGREGGRERERVI